MHPLAVRIHRPGPPGSLRLDSFPVVPPGPGEVRIRHAAIAVNFVDVYHRTGLYPLPALPAPLGVEAAGTVVELGPQVEGLRPGQRVGYVALPPGAYAAERNVPASRLLPLPDGVHEREAASLLLRGVTAHMLFNAVARVGPGSTVLVHAAAGGLGLVLVQWAKSLGAAVIGTASTPEKAEIARRHGADHVVPYRDADFVQAVRDLTRGRGADLVVDGVGGATLLRSLDAAAEFGMVASVGQSSGSLPAIEAAMLGPARSIALSRPSVFRYMADERRYRTAAAETLERAAAGLRVPVHASFALEDAAAAHALLESGTAGGAILLEPGAA